MASATIKITTTLYGKNSTSSKKLGVMKAGEKVEVSSYNYGWFCKCTHSKYGTGYALYFVNGNVHVSGSGVKAAIKANGGKIGDSSTGYQTKKSSGKEIAGKGIVKSSAVTLRKSKSKTSAVVGVIQKDINVTMEHIEPTTGWCYVTGYGKRPNSNKNELISGWYQYKTSSKTYIMATELTKTGGSSLTEVNNQAIVKNNDGNDNDTGGGDNPGGSTPETPEDGTDPGGNTDQPIPTGETAPTDYSAFSDKFSTYTKSAAYVKSVRGIYGMPYQFMNIVDPKISDGDGEGLYGRFYAERILSKMPLLILSPGIPKYTPDFNGSEEDTANVLKAIADMGLEGVSKIFDEIKADGDGCRFYTFVHAYDEYFEYLNPMCQQLAVYLGLDNKKIPLRDGGTSNLYTMLWQKYQNAYVYESGHYSSVGFYVDAESQISESISNSTGESQFGQTVNQVNDLSREIQFLMGGSAGKDMETLMGQNFDDAWQEIESFASKYSQVIPTLLVNRLKNTFDTIKVGGQLVFPEIWNDSDFGRNYDISIKLRTPDGDKFSWYMNIGVPLMHLLAFALPRRLGYNGIQSPFLVRAYYKSLFNVDMGIISNMTISRGDKCKWTLDGLPLEIDVNLTIKDLYQSLSIESVTNFCKNTAQLDYIANLCGININKPDILRTIILGYRDTQLKALTYLTDNGFLGVHQAIDNFTMAMYNSFLR